MSILWDPTGEGEWEPALLHSKEEFPPKVDSLTVLVYLDTEMALEKLQPHANEACPLASGPVTAESFSASLRVQQTAHDIKLKELEMTPSSILGYAENALVFSKAKDEKDSGDSHSAMVLAVKQSGEGGSVAGSNGGNV